MTPSADRTATDADNDATFILTNVLPQAPQHNRGLWAQLEAATRAEVTAGNEVSVIAGGAGTQGTLAEGQVTIPAALWKVLVILPAGTGDDLARITARTRVVAVWMPNDTTVAGTRWQD